MPGPRNWLSKLLLVGLVGGCSDKGDTGDDPADCEDGQTVCGGECAALTSDPLNCGECGHACPTGQSCSAGVCACAADYAECDGQCLDVTSDAQNCGACGEVCAAGQQCTSGTCQCQAGLTDCGGACVDLQTDGDNCGDCVVSCPTDQVCTSGACATGCPSGTTQCNSSCVDLSSDSLNCGACGVSCPAPQTCTAGSCACPTGLLDCGGQCVDTSIDLNNCGGCGVQCAGGATCSNGSCVGGGTGGGSGTGGVGAGGGTGGLGIGGALPTGGSAGMPPAGGSGGATGGAAGTGGSGTGGAGTGGGGTGGLETGGSGTGGEGTAGEGTAGEGTGGDVGGSGGGDTGGTAGTPLPGCAPPTDYPNLFVTVSGHTQEETDAKLTAAWNQLYNPSNPNTVYYDGPGSDESHVRDIGSGDVRSEGMSYGMMTAVQLDRQTEFDRLWAWILNHMAQGTGEIAWHCSYEGAKLSTGGAPDGEEYMATALIFAQNRWGNSGRFNYASEAQWVLDVIRTRYFNSTYHLIQFVTNSGNVDASYVLPSFYQVWACFDTANADFWNESVSAARQFFHAAADSNGVIGDRQTFTGDTLQGAGSDAKRCVMNIMMDHNFFAADPWQVDTYAPAFGAYTYNDMDSAQLPCNGLLGFALSGSSAQHFVDNLWSQPLPTGTWRYYAGTLHMLALLHVSGTFKLWY